MVADANPRNVYEAIVAPLPVAVFGEAVTVAVSVVRSTELP